MKKNFLRLILIFGLSVGLTSMLFAQRQVGTVTGTITDSEGNALPGVNVTASSPALMGIQSYLTAEGGTFRFPSLPPGTYTIKAELSGFKTTIRESIIVSVGTVATLNITLEMTTLEEEVTVVATAPVVDVTQSKTAITLDKNLIDNVPFARRFEDLVKATPGFGGARLHMGAGEMTGGYYGAEGMVVHGSSAQSNTFAYDGLIVNDPQILVEPITRMNTDTIDEVEIVTGGHSSETPYTSGAYINVVTKSGGNAFSGGAILYYSGKQFVESLWTKEQVQSLGVQMPVLPEFSLDTSISIGGPIFHDKLWFYSSFRYEELKQRGNFIEWTDPLGIFHSNYDIKHNAKTFFIKLTSQITKKLKIFAYFDFCNTIDTTGEYEPTPYQLEIETNYYDQNRYTYKANMTYVFTQNLFVDLAAGHARRYFPSMSQLDGAGRPWIQDSGTPYGSFTGRARDSINYRRSTSIQADLTYFKDNLFGGTHEMKTGLRYEYNPSAYDNYYPSNLQWYWSNGPYYYGTTTWKGVPNVGKGRIQYQNMGTYKGSVHMPRLGYRLGAFIQDSMTFKKRLTVNLGIRFDYQITGLGACFKDVGGDPMSIWLGENYVRPYTKAMWPEYFPDGINPFAKRTMEDWKKIFTWTNLNPRIGITYDVFGNQKTAFKASFSRYSDYLNSYGPHPLSRRSFRFDWYDTNPNPGVDPSTPWLMIDDKDDFVVYPTDYRVLSLDYAKRSIDPDHKSPLTDEFVLGIQHELVKDFLFGVNFIYKNHLNIMQSMLYSYDLDEYWYHIDQELAKKSWVPFTTIVPGFDGYPDSTVTIYARKNDAPAIFSREVNAPELERKYWGFEFIFNKRMSNGWQLSGSVCYSKTYGNSGGYYREDTSPGNPNGFINSYGRLPQDIPLFIKLSSTANLGNDFLLSTYFRYFNGEPWWRSANIRPPTSWCNANNAYRDYYSVYLEPVGTRRYRSVNFVDLRIEKEFKIGGFGKAGIFLDCYNLFGYNTIELGQRDVYRYNPSAENVREPNNVTLEPTYKKIGGVQGLRNVRFSIKFTF